MKKMMMFAAVAVLLLPLAVGCSSSGSNSSSSSGWSLCRSGSLWPTSRRNQAAHEVVYSAQQCDPCQPNACVPCEPVSCNPCDPICDPCKPRTSSYSITPAPFGG